jgi:hypothetical protein
MTHLTYPDESFTYRYAFQPIPAEEVCRDGHLACWTDESGTVPFAVIKIPDGTQITETQDGWQLQVPDEPAWIHADFVYELAARRFLGMVLIQGPQPDDDDREHYWETD